MIGNSGIPGPFLFVTGAMTENFAAWIAVNMAMCIGIEGAIYHYLKLFSRPYVGSAVANLVSLVAGVPLVFLGAFDPTVIVIPTLLSIAVELLVLIGFRAGKRSIVWPSSAPTSSRTR